MRTWGLGHARLIEVSKEIDVIVNGAATIKFYERSVEFSAHKFSVCDGILYKYLVNDSWLCRDDVAFDANVM